MRIISTKTLFIFFKEQHADAESAIKEWIQKTEKSEWDSFSDIKKTFNSVDSVGNKRFVFNIRGNNYRLIALILFKLKIVYIRFIGTHKEYDNIKDCSTI